MGHRWPTLRMSIIITKGTVAHRVQFAFPHRILSALDCKKKKHNVKVENYVLFGRYTKDVSPGDSRSASSEGLF